jgi:uncharacterized protein YdcH (DUF465 family)
MTQENQTQDSTEMPEAHNTLRSIGKVFDTHDINKQWGIDEVEGLLSADEVQELRKETIKLFREVYEILFNKKCDNPMAPMSSFGSVDYDWLKDFFGGDIEKREVKAREVTKDNRAKLTPLVKRLNQIKEKIDNNNSQFCDFYKAEGDASGFDDLGPGGWV